MVTSGDMERRVDRLQNEVESIYELIDDFRRETRARLDRLDTQVAALTERLDRLDSGVEAGFAAILERLPAGPAA